MALTRFYTSIRLLVVPALAAVVATSGQALAVPYASQVRESAVDTFEFVLNESADKITILRDGANPFVIDTPSAGRHTFSMAGFSSFEIQVDKDAPLGWTEISDAANLWTNVERPVGLAVNKDSSSPYFGTVYIANPREQATAVGRPMAAGIQSLSADLIGVDLTTFTAYDSTFDLNDVNDDINDVTLWKSPGFETTLSASSPRRINLDDGGNLIIGDFSDASGGIKYTSPDLSTGGLVLATEGDSAANHGSITSEPVVMGTLGTDLVIYAMDEDFLLPVEQQPNEGFHNMFRWDVGSTASDFTGAPTLQVDSASLPSFLPAGIPGVTTDATYSPTHDKWYITQRRADGNEPSLYVVSPDPDGINGNENDQVVEFNSLQFTIDNALDGFDDSVVTGIQDILRWGGSVEISPDGDALYLHRHLVQLAPNQSAPVDTNYPGAVLIIPLDENGIPIITIESGLVTNWDSISIANNNSSHTTAAETELDAAGNVYTSSNSAERVQVFSPGGATRAITTSSGTFSVEELVIDILAGDFNGDGIVNAADYTVWRDNLTATDESLINDAGLADGVVDINDYNIWKAAFGNAAGAGSLATTGAVPEPSAVILTLLGVGFSLFGRRRG